MHACVHILTTVYSTVQCVQYSDQWPEVRPPHRCGSNVTNYAPSPAQLSSRSRRQTPTRESRETKFKLSSGLNTCEHNAVDG